MASSFINLVIIIDALGKRALNQLLEECQFNGSMSGTFIPPFSFEPDTSYLSGHYPGDTDSGTHFWYNGENSQLLFQSTIRSCIRKCIRNTASIPFSFLPYFDVVQKKKPVDQGFCEFPTVFDLLRQGGMRWIYLGTPVNSAKHKEIQMALRNRDLKETDLVMLFIGDLDAIGHRYGPNSAEYAVAVKEIGESIRNILDYSQEFNKKIRTLIFGDHGMVEINRTIDVQSPLKQLPIKPIRDYMYFLDSTLARFWFINDKARKIITEYLKTLKYGRIISESDRSQYHINYKHNRFGELIWWADGGTLIYPNFWQAKRPVNGMHGYRRDVLDNHAGFVLVDSALKNRTVLDKPLEMVDAFATMTDMLRLDFPKNADGISLYQRAT